MQLLSPFITVQLASPFPLSSVPSFNTNPPHHLSSDPDCMLFLSSGYDWHRLLTFLLLLRKFSRWDSTLSQSRIRLQLNVIVNQIPLNRLVDFFFG